MKTPVTDKMPDIATFPNSESLEVVTHILKKASEVGILALVQVKDR
jgi:hypothetical protein